MSGRTPIDPNIVPVFGASKIWGDVWRSDDRGAPWSQVVASETPGHWAPRAYFEALTVGDQKLVSGGQDFDVLEIPGPMGPQQVPVSNFFNDVWSSPDGIVGEQRTPDAGWEGRAGLSSIVYRD